MGGRLDGRTAVVTGSSGGIGRATAKRFAAEGATVVCADVDAEAGEKAAAEIGGLFVPTDVTDEAQVQALFQRAVDEGDLPVDTDAGRLARYLMTVCFGIAVQAASGIGRDDLQEVADTALRAWPPA